MGAYYFFSSNNAPPNRSQEDAEFIVTVSEQALRMYAIQSMLACSRTTVRKETIELSVTAASPSKVRIQF